VPDATARHTYANGLTLLVEPMPHVRSATFALMAPAGTTREDHTKLGVASAMAELLTRGAGDRGSQELATALDNLGTDRNESVGPYNLVLGAGTLGRNVPAALKIYADIVRRPHLPADELGPVKELLTEDILGLDDSPQDMVMLELKRRYYPAPFDRSRFGDADAIAALTIGDVKAHYEAHVHARGAILSVAGAVDFEHLRDLVGELFGDWPGRDVAPLAPAPHDPQSGHLTRDTQQTQVALAVPSAPFTDRDYYAARGAVGVLSGGMSSRLFTEVREKRGLCYSVYASHDTVKDRAALVCYAGTRNDRAQETLDVMVAELRRLRDGVTDEELARLRVTLKTALVMQQESTGARASAMASDWFYLNRVRTLDEIMAAVNAVDEAAIVAYLDRFPVDKPTVVTLGPTELTLPN
jgi:predicted Zn-dependent peptidase